MWKKNKKIARVIDGDEENEEENKIITNPFKNNPQKGNVIILSAEFNPENHAFTYKLISNTSIGNVGDVFEL